EVATVRPRRAQAWKPAFRVNAAGVAGGGIFLESFLLNFVIIWKIVCNFGVEIRVVLGDWLKKD
ncbi:MAG: hypothetical protein J1E84_06625, partial [Muribaculaceae bacterium]|nr:hypothetical protein [Muribaculaceae bacterium]